MKNFLLDIDIKIFRFINGTLYNPLAERIMWIFANDVFLIAVLFLGFIYILKKDIIKGKINIAFALLAIIFTNIINSMILKNIFKRNRPAVDLNDVNFLVYMRKLNYAFPSTHTAMVTALVIVLWDDYKELRPILFFFLLLVAFFCIYTGGHYPFDVLAGFIVGFIIGIFFNWIKKKYTNRYNTRQGYK
ncbi:MAG: phosphatase PAP2 family protein [Candidatus Goldbacteria bacterium]|nr:phosphatase PAP2 family protein [Candidatus Goldiibacteriota bacterium]